MRTERAIQKPRTSRVLNAPRKVLKVGRPAEIDKQRLLDIAEESFSEKGFAGTSTREVARRARCNSAMIAYYFGGKGGIYDAVLRRHFERTRDRFLSSRESSQRLEAPYFTKWPELKDASQRQFCGALYEFSISLLANPAMHKIIYRELLSGAKRMIRSLAQLDYGLHVVILRALKEFKENGIVGGEFDERCAVVSLMGPICYSFMAKGILKEVLGFKNLDEAYMRSLCIYLTRTFFGAWAK